MLEALQMVSASWNALTAETVSNCFIKANGLPRCNALIKSLTTLGSSGDAATLNQAEKAGGDIEAAVEPTDEESIAITEKMDRIVAIVVSNPSTFTHPNNHRHEVHSDIVIAQDGTDKVKAALDVLTFGRWPRHSAETQHVLDPLPEENDDDTDNDDDNDENGDDVTFSEDDLQIFEQLSKRFLATVRQAAGAKH